MKSCALMFVTVWLASVALRADEGVNYTEQIKPILKARCYACHGALKQEGELRLDTASLIRQGGDSGPAIEPGSAEQSELVERISSHDEDYRMPPEGEPLTAEQIVLFRAWIDQNASAPADEQPEEDPRLHWAFQRPQRGALPKVKHPDWVSNPVDAFIAAQHDKQGLTPNEPAPRHVLLRRLYLDLIGLPPTRDRLHAFLADETPQAYEKVVDQLLASPQYGERWGRHWMDVWRYSDWYGRRKENDVRNSYPNIWRWRDWIVDSLNDDKGYDRMIVEMLAGDEVAPGDDATVVATGFIVRNWFSLNYDVWKRDLVEHTGKAFLALRFNCAHCHDHKYDSISQQEYFSFRAFFEPIELRHDRAPGGEAVPRFQKYSPEGSTRNRPFGVGMIRVFDETMDAKTYMYRMGDARQRMEDQPPVEPATPAMLGGDPLNIQPVELAPVAYYPGLRSFVEQESKAKWQTAIAQAEETIAKETSLAKSDEGALKLVVAKAQIANARAQIASLQARLAADQVKHQHGSGDLKKLALIASQLERAASLTAAQFALAQGEFTLHQVKNKDEADSVKKAAAIKKATAPIAGLKKAVTKAEQALAQQSDQYTPLSPIYPKKSTGRRTALANWIASDKNPLTARVAVNHIWMRHFNRPLVASVFDFGRSGQQPTHPVLLDYLAVELMESSWSMKKLHRLMVTSNTYKMRSDGANSANRAIDSDNVYLWSFNSHRIEAEVVRDSILHSAEQLELTLGGEELDPKLGPTTFRRSLYYSVYPEAGGQLSFAALFDPPSPTDCYRRSESIVPQQALAMTNGRLSLNQGRLLAKQLWQTIQQEEPEPSAQRTAFITAAFEQIISRRPSDEELQLCHSFLDQQTKLFQSADKKQLTGATKTGLVAASIDVDQRARESLVRSLYSHHDFVTIR